MLSISNRHRLSFLTEMERKFTAERNSATNHNSAILILFSFLRLWLVVLFHSAKFLLHGMPASEWNHDAEKKIGNREDRFCILKWGENYKWANLLEFWLFHWSSKFAFVIFILFEGTESTSRTHWPSFHQGFKPISCKNESTTIDFSAFDCNRGILIYVYIFIYIYIYVYICICM